MRAAERQVSELLADPARFFEEGKSYALLEQCLAGVLPIQDLKPLLNSRDIVVRRVAAFVASELGERAASLVEDVVPLVASGDRYLQYHAMEVLAVCATGNHSELFSRVVEGIDSDDVVLQELAMRLTFRADSAQIKAACEVLLKKPSKSNVALGIAALRNAETLDPDAVKAMLSSEDPLIRRYGATVASRLSSMSEPLLRAMRSSEDPEIRRFCERIGLSDPDRVPNRAGE